MHSLLLFPPLQLVTIDVVLSRMHLFLCTPRGIVRQGNCDFFTFLIGYLLYFAGSLVFRVPVVPSCKLSDENTSELLLNAS